MSQEITLTWQSLGVIAALMIHVVVIVRWATLLGAKADRMVDAVSDIKIELKKRDEQILAAFRKIDGLSDRMLRVEMFQEQHGCAPGSKK